MAIEIRKARREKLKAAINFMGTSGSAKTASSLRLAKGLMNGMFPEATDEERWEKIGLVDTEHRRSELYADNYLNDGTYIGEFTVASLEPPHNIERYVEAIRALKSAGCEVIVVDSMSHAWQGEGGLLDKQQDMGGRFQDWAKLRPVERQLWAEIFDKNDVHMITTMRVKQEYALEKNDVDKLEVKKMGLKAVQNDQLEYEYMINFRTEMNHKVWASKDNSGLFGDKGQFQVTEETGENLFNWLEKGKDVRAEEKAKRLKMIEEIEFMVEESVLAGAKLTDIERHPKVNTELKDMDYVTVIRTMSAIKEVFDEDVAQKAKRKADDEAYKAEQAAK